MTELVAGQYQPRTRMDEGALYELAESIKSQGVMQPILVRELKGGDNAGKYEIIASKALRASSWPGWTQMPVLVGRPVARRSGRGHGADRKHAAGRPQDPWKKPRVLQRLVKEFGLTHEQEAAQAVGRSRSCGLEPAAPVAAGRAGADHADGRRP
ncbi:MAG: ParB/RepB/Spo0J family partition protein [Burkholderiaceae bacterium]